MTRSIAPMSMPSSSELVATRPRRRARFQHLFDHETLLARDRAMVRANQRRTAGILCFGFVELVQALRQALGQAATVDEDQRRALRLDQLEQARVDRRPDRVGCLGAQAFGQDGAARRRRRRLWIVHVFERDDDLQVEPFALAHIDERDLTVGAAEKAAHFVERALGGGQADALHRVFGDDVKAFQGQRQVGAALGGGYRMDLVDDDPADRPEDLVGTAGQQQVERLGRRDQNVWRGAGNVAAFGCGCIASANGDVNLGWQ